MAAPTPPMASTFGLTPALCSYKEFYSNVDNDPYNGNYNSLLTPYITNIAGGATHTPMQVAEMVYSASQHHLPTAFLVVGEDSRLHAYHRVTKFSPRLGLPATIWDGEAFATSGDLFRNSPVAVDWDNNRFHQTAGNIQVPLAATIDTAIADATLAAPVTMFGPYAASDAGSEPVRGRMCCFLPPKYVGIWCYVGM